MTADQFSNSDRIRASLSHLERYLAYYLDCVREDEREGVRYFLSDEGKRFLVPPLQREWGLEEGGVLSVRLEGNAATFTQSVRLQRGTGTLFYGYPLYVDWIEKSQKGWSGGFAVPVFLLPVEYEPSGSTLQLRLINDWPRVNGEFLKSVLPIAEERRTFLREIGLLEAEGDPPDEGLAYFAHRLKELAIAPEAEPIEPTMLGTTPPVSALGQGGLYNRCVVVLGERSKFTAGLEHELEALRNGSTLTTAEATSLRLFFADPQAPRQTLASSTPKPQDLIEVVSLNDEQRAVVRSAFEQPLTWIIHVSEDKKSLRCYKHLVNRVFKAHKEAFTWLSIPQHSVCCSPIFFPSQSWPSSTSGRAVLTGARFC